ncbi:MAG: hypothetical protein Fur0020_03620 [Thermodesulfovibrionia bacterium]
MEVLITDLTYMHGGVCIAGINIETLENIRPVLKFGHIQKDFVDRNNIYPGALIRFDFLHKKSNPPHIEDHVFEPANVEFIKYLTQADWTNILDSCAFLSLASAFNNLIVDKKGVSPGAKTSSLAVIKVDSIKMNFFDSDKGALLPFKTRVSFTSGGDTYHLPVTDLQFIDYCINRFDSGIARNKLKNDLEEFINDSEYIYLRIGLTRPFKKAEDADELCYLQVNGIYSDNLDNEIRYITLSNTEGIIPKEKETNISTALQFRLFNIPIDNGENELEQLNTFLCNVEVKRFNASVVDNTFWSILLGYTPNIPKKVKSAKNEKLSCESIAELSPDDMELYERLRKWRNDKAQTQNVPEYFVFSNKTLMTIAKARPETIDMLMNISGIGEKKIGDYGDEVLRIVSEKI